MFHDWEVGRLNQIKWQSRAESRLQGGKDKVAAVSFSATELLFSIADFAAPPNVNVLFGSRT